MLSCDYNGWNDMPEEERESMEDYLGSSRLAIGLAASRASHAELSEVRRTSETRQGRAA